MDRESVNEKIAFNRKEEDLPVYFDCFKRSISSKTPEPIYHYHDNIELLYCIKGELEITLFSKTVILREGDFIYIAPNTPHSSYAHTEKNEHFCLKFLSSVLHVPSSRKLPTEDYFVSLVNSYEYFPREADGDGYIKDLFFDCYNNFSHENYFKRLRLRADIMLIMSYIFDKTTSIENKETLKSIPPIFLDVLDYIDRNYATVTLEDAANFCSLSYSYFSRTFKSAFGISFSNYIIKKRIEKSLLMISGSNLSLNDIALECGFANLSHFIKCFNEEKGMTPKKLRTVLTNNK